MPMYTAHVSFRVNDAVNHSPSVPIVMAASLKIVGQPVLTIDAERDNHHHCVD